MLFRAYGLVLRIAYRKLTYAGVEYCEVAIRAARKGDRYRTSSPSADPDDFRIRAWLQSNCLSVGPAMHVLPGD